MLRYFFCKVICICQNGSVAGRQPPGEDVEEGCSVSAAYQNGPSYPRFEGRLYFFTTMGPEVCSSILAQTRLQTLYVACAKRFCGQYKNVIAE